MIFGIGLMVSRMVMIIGTHQKIPKRLVKYIRSNGSKEIQDMSTHNKLGILIEQYVSASLEKEAKEKKRSCINVHERNTWWS